MATSSANRNVRLLGGSPAATNYLPGQHDDHTKTFGQPACFVSETNSQMLSGAWCAGLFYKAFAGNKRPRQRKDKCNDRKTCEHLALASTWADQKHSLRAIRVDGQSYIQQGEF